MVTLTFVCFLMLKLFINIYLTPPPSQTLMDKHKYVACTFRDGSDQHFLTCYNLLCRFSLILSKAVKLDIDLDSVDIKCVDDIPCMVNILFFLFLCDSFSLFCSLLFELLICYEGMQLRKERSLFELQDDDGDVVYNKNGEPKIHTDGTGFISEDLAMKCPKNIFKGECSINDDFQVALL